MITARSNVRFRSCADRKSTGRWLTHPPVTEILPHNRPTDQGCVSITSAKRDGLAVALTAMLSRPKRVLDFLHATLRFLAAHCRSFSANWDFAPDRFVWWQFPALTRHITDTSRMHNRNSTCQHYTYAEVFRFRFGRNRRDAPPSNRVRTAG